MGFFKYYLRLVFSGTSAATALAKYGGLAIAWLLFAFVARASLRLSIVWPIGNETVAEGDHAAYVVAAIIVFGGWAMLCMGLAWARFPSLRIVEVASSKDRHRITVKSSSSDTMQFTAQLTEIHPSITHHIPSHLQITGATPPYREGSIAPGRTSQVDVLYLDGSGEVMFLFSNPPVYNPVGVDKADYIVRIDVFSAHPSTGSGDSRLFRISPRHGAVDFEMLPRHGAWRETVTAIGWLLGGLIAIVISAIAAGGVGLALGTAASMYLVWYAMRSG